MNKKVNVVLRNQNQRYEPDASPGTDEKTRKPEICSRFVADETVDGQVEVDCTTPIKIESINFETGSSADESRCGDVEAGRRA